MDSKKKIEKIETESGGSFLNARSNLVLERQRDEELMK